MSQGSNLHDLLKPTGQGSIEKRFTLDKRIAFVPAIKEDSLAFEPGVEFVLLNKVGRSANSMPMKIIMIDSSQAPIG